MNDKNFGIDLFLVFLSLNIEDYVDDTVAISSCLSGIEYCSVPVVVLRDEQSRARKLNFTSRVLIRRTIYTISQY